MINNNFPLETEAAHQERSRKLANGIVDHGSELGFSDDEIAEVMAYPEKFLEVFSKQKDAEAKQAACNVVLAKALAPARKQFARCRSLVRGEVAYVDGDKAKYLRDVFRLDIRTPRRNAEFAEFARDMLTAFDNLAVEHPDISMPAEPFEELRILVEALEAADKAVIEVRAAKKLATYKKNQLRKYGNSLISRVYRRAVSYWGNNDSRLFVLGFLPKSEVWTKKGAAGPQP